MRRDDKYIQNFNHTTYREDRDLGKFWSMMFKGSLRKCDKAMMV
jgi:hypothetical protein